MNYIDQIYNKQMLSNLEGLLQLKNEFESDLEDSVRNGAMYEIVEIKAFKLYGIIQRIETEIKYLAERGLRNE